MTNDFYYGSFEDDPPRSRKRKPDGSRETDTERYWREISERQQGENRPEYDPWTDTYF